MVDARFTTSSPLSTDDGTDAKWNPITALSSNPTDHELEGWKDSDGWEKWNPVYSHTQYSFTADILDCFDGMEKTINDSVIKITNTSTAAQRLLRYGLIRVNKEIKDVKIGRHRKFLTKLSGIIDSGESMTHVKTDGISPKPDTGYGSTVGETSIRLAWNQKAQLGELASAAMCNKIDLYRFGIYYTTANLPDELILEIGPKVVKRAQGIVDGFESYLLKVMTKYKQTAKVTIRAITGKAVVEGLDEHEIMAYENAMEYCKREIPGFYRELEDYHTAIMESTA